MARPAKPSLSEVELAEVERIAARGGRGGGIRAQAAAVSRLRGADAVLTVEARKARRVSHQWLLRELAKRSKTRSGPEPQVAQEEASLVQGPGIAVETLNRTSSGGAS